MMRLVENNTSVKTRSLTKEVCVPTIFFYGPKLTKDKRRELIKSFTDAASQATGVDRKSFTVYLRETSHEDVGVGGELLEDRQPKSS